MTTRRKNTSIAAALKTLEDAARDKRDEVQSALSGNYENLRSLVLENEKSLLKTFHHAKDSAVEAATDLEKEGVRKAREMGHDVDKNVHEFPWRYMGGSLLAGLVLGFVLKRETDG